MSRFQVLKARDSYVRNDPDLINSGSNLGNFEQRVFRSNLKSLRQFKTPPLQIDHEEGRRRRFAFAAAT
jgi:hypothetical protein